MPQTMWYRNGRRDRLPYTAVEYDANGIYGSSLEQRTVLRSRLQ